MPERAMTGCHKCEDPRINGERLADLDFRDDIILMAKDA